MTDPLDDDEFEERAELVSVDVSDAWVDIMETQAFLRDDPRDWGVVSTSRFGRHHLEVYVEGYVDDYASHEGAIVPSNLLRFMAGRGWHVTRFGLGQAPSTDEWVPHIAFSRGPEVFDALTRNGLPVEPDGYDWPSLYDVLAGGDEE